MAKFLDGIKVLGFLKGIWDSFNQTLNSIFARKESKEVLHQDRIYQKDRVRIEALKKRELQKKYETRKKQDEIERKEAVAKRRKEEREQKRIEKEQKKKEREQNRQQRKASRPWNRKKNDKNE